MRSIITAFPEITLLAKSLIISLLFVVLLFVSSGFILVDVNDDFLKPSVEESLLFESFTKQSNWICDCKRRVRVEIEGNTDALTNYQVKFEIPRFTDIASDYSNLLFTSSDQVTIIDHWRQSYNATN